METRDTTLFFSLKKNTLKVITGKKNSNFVLFLNILKNEVVLSRGRTRLTRNLTTASKTERRVI